jgi:hypothetical protein
LTNSLRTRRLAAAALMSRSRRLSAAVVVSIVAAAVPALFQADPGAASSTPRVSVISDSILTSVTWGDGSALAALSDGLDLQIDAAVCRRLNGESCEFNGGRAPTTLSVINSWRTQLGAIVVIVDGYNDLPDAFAGDVELTLNTLRDDQVQHVLWVNLHEVLAEYVAKNAVLAAAARRHPELRVLDWNSYAAGHPEWFQTDFVHLRPLGGTAIAAWIHQAIMDTLSPPPLPPPSRDTALVVSTRTLVARVGVRFDRRLHASGGTAPLRWRTTGASLRGAGIHLLASGELIGRPAHARTLTVPLEVTDAGGSSARATVTLTVSRGPG